MKFISNLQRKIAAIDSYGRLMADLIWQARWSLSREDRRQWLHHATIMGVEGLPLVMLVGLFAGGLMAWQAAYQFKGMVSLSMLGGQVARALMMEMTPVLTGLVVAGRTGAAIAAEISIMQSTEQVDALEVMGVDPVRHLVTPRVLALTLMLPLLTLYALVIAIGGAFFVANIFLDITTFAFFESVRDFFALRDIVGGVAKTAIFGFLIGLSGSWYGLNAERSSIGVGKATVSAFVLGAVLVLITDFFLWLVIF